MSFPTQQENPNGLHLRYLVSKANGQPVDADADYLVFRIDDGGSDPIHVNAGRVAGLAYANAIEHHLPQVAADVRARCARATAPRPAAGAAGVVGEAVLTPLVPLSEVERFYRLSVKLDEAKDHGAPSRIYDAQDRVANNVGPALTHLLTDLIAMHTRAALTTPPAAPEAGAAGSGALVGAWVNWMDTNSLPRGHREVELWNGDTKRAFAYLDEDDDPIDGGKFWVLSSNMSDVELEEYCFWRYAAAPVPPSATRCEGNCATAQGLCVNPVCPMEGGREA